VAIRGSRCTGPSHVLIKSVHERCWVFIGIFQSIACKLFISDLLCFLCDIDNVNKNQRSLMELTIIVDLHFVEQRGVVV
jgi:hypothetical protein